MKEPLTRYGLKFNGGDPALFAVDDGDWVRYEDVRHLEQNAVSRAKKGTSQRAQLRRLQKAYDWMSKLFYSGTSVRAPQPPPESVAGLIPIITIIGMFLWFMAGLFVGHRLW